MTRSIWLFLDSRGNGGIESHVAALAQALRQADVPISLVLWQRYEQPHPLEQQLKESGIPLFYLQGKLSHFYRLAQQQKPLVIHTHGYKAGLIARLFKWALGYRLVASFHAGEVTVGKLGFYDGLDRYTASFADQTIAISQEIAQRIRAKSELIENFVNLPVWVPPKAQQAEIAFVGRLSEEKGPERFVELARLFPDLQFAIYGDGPLMAELKTDAPANIRFYGMVTSMAQHWHNIQLLCMPSRFEGLPMAALEAMSHGIPVMASAVGELPRLIEQGRNGYLISEGEDASWVHTLQSWLNLPLAQQQNMAKKARMTIDKSYSVTNQLPKFLAVYGIEETNFAKSYCSN